MARFVLAAYERRELSELSEREQRRYWGFRRRQSHLSALQSARDAESNALHASLASCGCPRQIIRDAGHQEGCERA